METLFTSLQKSLNFLYTLGYLNNIKNLWFFCLQFHNDDDGLPSQILHFVFIQLNVSLCFCITLRLCLCVKLWVKLRWLFISKKMFCIIIYFFFPNGWNIEENADYGVFLISCSSVKPLSTNKPSNQEAVTEFLSWLCH